MDYYESIEFKKIKDTCNVLMSSQKEFNEYINEKVQDDFNHSLMMYNIEVANLQENGDYDAAEFMTEDADLIQKIKDHEGHKGW